MVLGAFLLTALPASAISTTQVQTANLKACWSADQYTGGTTWTDAVSKKSITFTSAPTSGADGVELTSGVTFTSEDLSALSVTSPCTFEWVGRIDGSWSQGNVFALGPVASTWTNDICCYSSSSEGLYLDMGNGYTRNPKSASSTAAGVYHIVVVINDAGEAIMYVNGAKATGTNTSDVAKLISPMPKVLIASMVAYAV